MLKCDQSLDFGIGDAKSTSGTLAPMTYLFAPQNIEPERCFKQVRAANHQANLFAVANGVLDVATNNSTAIRLQGIRDEENRANGQPTVADKVKVIWESPKLPEDPIVWRKDLDPAVKEKVRQFFLTYGKGEGPEAERVIRHLVAQGNTLIFGTTFGYMEPMLKVAADNPNVKFEHGTGYKTAANMRTYDSRTYEGAYMAGVIAGSMTKSNCSNSSDPRSAHAGPRCLVTHRYP